MTCTQPVTCKPNAVSADVLKLFLFSCLATLQFVGPGASVPLGAQTTATTASGNSSVASPSAAAQTAAQDAAPSQSTGGPSAGPSTGVGAQGAGLAGVVDTAHYVIGPDDMLQVTVWREPSLSGSLPVRPDGMISLVLIGDLKAAGRTPMQLSSDITLRLKRYIQDPVVSVAVTADTSQRVFLVGQVGKVGPISMSPGMTPLQAISAAGGPGPYANVKHIYILRGAGDHQQKIPFNYKQALKGEGRQGLVLLPGDTIIVP